jgi:hypothetical protein
MAYSYDGINWYGVPSCLNSTNPSPLFNTGLVIGSNSRIGVVIVDSQLTLSNKNLLSTQKLDLVSGSYYDQSYTNFTSKITSHDL